MHTKGKNLARVEQDQLLDEALEQTFPASHPVALMPGSGFGMPGHIRISFATSEETLRDTKSATAVESSFQRSAATVVRSTPKHRIHPLGNDLARFGGLMVDAAQESAEAIRLARRAVELDQMDDMAPGNAGVAKFYGGLLDRLIVDSADAADHANEIPVFPGDILMKDAAGRRRVAQLCIDCLSDADEVL
jgi:hypothetical protein